MLVVGEAQIDQRLRQAESRGAGLQCAHTRAQGRGSEAGTIIIPIGQMETLRHRVVTGITQQVSRAAVSWGLAPESTLLTNLKLWHWEVVGGGEVAYSSSG